MKEKKKEENQWKKWNWNEFSITISVENRGSTTITWLEHTGQMPQRSCRNTSARDAPQYAVANKFWRDAPFKHARGVTDPAPIIKISCRIIRGEETRSKKRFPSISSCLSCSIQLRRVYPALSSLRSIGFSLTRLKICPEFRRIVYATCEKSWFFFFVIIRSYYFSYIVSQNDDRWIKKIISLSL